MTLIKLIIFTALTTYLTFGDENVLTPQAVAHTNKVYETRLATLKAALVRRKRQCCSQCITNNGCGCGGCPQIIQPMQPQTYQCTPICMPMCTSACVQQYQSFPISIPQPQPQVTCVDACMPTCQQSCLQSVQIQIQQQCEPRYILKPFSDNKKTFRCMPACQPSCLQAVQIQPNQIQCSLFFTKIITKQKIFNKYLVGVQPCMPNCNQQCIQRIIPNCPNQCMPMCSPQCIQANLVSVRPTCVQVN
uniref:Uncharacterized protein n=1 Tax=Panagrolaimus superbus TaxID=310955 RepID=A0A914XW19_9BILA